VHRFDAQRIQRALEVYLTTGSPLSSLQTRRQPPELGCVLTISLLPADRAQLHASIRERFRAMLDAGLVDEVKSLRARHALLATMPSMRAVGYRQVWQMLEGELPQARLLDAGTAATRQLAKRQFTWLRALPGMAFDPASPTTTQAVADAVLDATATALA